MPPVIAISAYAEAVDRGVWRAITSTFLPHAYAESVRAAGGIALLVPPRPDADPDLAEAILDRVDGLVIAGGPDVDPRCYGAAPDPHTQPPHPERDATEIALVRAALRRGTPMLGICRGMQVMAVAGGGRLIQHLPDVVGHDGHAFAPGTYTDHPVRILPGTRLATILGEAVTVPSSHHQAVATHPGYLASAYAPDGTLEAMEMPGRPFRVGVQWHPEVSRDGRLFTALIEAADQGGSAARRQASTVSIP